MKFTKRVPNIFHVEIEDGIRMFVDCLEFEIAREFAFKDYQLGVVIQHG